MRNDLIKGAREYKKYVGKQFMIITENHKCFYIEFSETDFKHLTGVRSNLNDDDFYRYCCKNQLSVGNINTIQYKNLNTLKSKISGLCHFNYFLYADASTNLFLTDVVTKSFTYPVGIRNDSKKIAIGFKDRDMDDFKYARTLRKAKTTLNNGEEQLINAIFSKNKESVKYDEIVYIRDFKSLIYLESDHLELICSKIAKKIEFLV